MASVAAADSEEAEVAVVEHQEIRRLEQRSLMAWEVLLQVIEWVGSQ